MKYALNLVILAACLLVIPGCTTVDSSADAVVVRAEQTVKSTVDILDTFLKLEYSNRAFYEQVSPEIHAYAQIIRRDAPGYIESARTLTKAYKTTRTADAKDAMVTALAVIETMATEATKHLTRLQTIRTEAALNTNVVANPPSAPIIQTNPAVITPPTNLDLPGNTLTNCTNCVIPPNPNWVSPTAK